MNNAVEIYQSSDGAIQLDVHLDKETVWLSQKQISELFGTGIPAISKHIKNIIRDKELKSRSTVSKMEIVRKEGTRTVNRKIEIYNLDMVISVGYRVNSLRATHFRQWATQTIKQHLIRGYTFNRQRVEAMGADVGQHIANILKENELDENSVVKNYFTTSADGKEYNVTFYSLETILAIGFRVRSKRGTQFRIWANRNLKEYMIKGFIMDDERLKNPDGRPDYFDELLELIREIRASEKRFYQKVRDLFALSSDYDKTDKATQMFFAETQNKLLFAVTRHTAAEIIVNRADAAIPNMDLTSWKGGVVRKQDIFIAKNYLTKDEINILNRLVVIFLETAELRAKNRNDITIKFWQENVDRILEFNEQPLLTGKGTISKTTMEKKIKEIYQLFDQKRKTVAAKQADLDDLAELKKLETKLGQKI